MHISEKRITPNSDTMALWETENWNQGLYHQFSNGRQSSQCWVPGRNGTKSGWTSKWRGLWLGKLLLRSVLVQQYQALKTILPAWKSMTMIVLWSHQSLVLRLKQHQHVGSWVSRNSQSQYALILHWSGWLWAFWFCAQHSWTWKVQFKVLSRCCQEYFHRKPISNYIDSLKTLHVIYRNIVPNRYNWRDCVQHHYNLD